jgi:hypothetical protein
MATGATMDENRRKKYDDQTEELEIGVSSI